MSNESISVYEDDDPNASVHHDGGSDVMSSSDADILERGRAGDTAKVVGPSPTEKMSGSDIAVSRNMEQEAVTAESPKNLFMQAYEAVRNTDKVSNIVDNVAIWWKGRHIDAIERDIQRLEGLVSSQNREVIRHEERLQASDEAAAKLAAMKQGLGLRDTAPSNLDHREGEYSAVKGRAEAHRIAGEKIARELTIKRELKEKFEQGRKEARSRIAERFENNINTNIEATRVIDSNIDQIQQNIGVAESIVAGLQDKQEVARSISNNPAVLSGDKAVARALAQDLGGRIQDMFSKMQLQKDRIAQYENKKNALETQKAKWEAKIAKKSEQAMVNNEETSDAEKEEGFVMETEQQIQAGEDALVGDEALIPEVAVHASEATNLGKDPRISMIEELRDLIHRPELARYDSPEFQEVLLENGTLEEKVLVRTYGMFTRMFNPMEGDQDSEELDPVSFAQEYDEIIDDYIDNPEIAALFDPDNRKNIENGNGTPEQQFLVKLFVFFEYVFSSMDIRVESKKSNENLV